MPDEHELFLVLQGRLRMQFRDREIVVEAGGSSWCPTG